MATRLYFHAANSTISGTLPSTEQSTLTAGSTGDAETVNRSMDTTKGTSQATVSDTPIGSEITNHYFTKFVSPLLNQTSVAANTWTYAFTAAEGDTSNNFPVDGTNQPVRVCCYVWKPSNGTKYGNILDGNTASTVDEGNANQQRWHIVTFSGSAVSSLTAGDAVIVFEVWFVCDTSASVGGSDIFYFDGTNDTTAENGTTTSAASYLQTPENLTFLQGTTYERAPSADSTTVSDSSLTRIRSLARVPSADTSNISDSSLTRIRSLPRAPSSDSTNVSETQLDAFIIKPRSPSPDTTTISDASLIRLKSSTRVPSADSSNITDSSLTRILSSNRAPSSDDTTVTEASLTSSKIKQGIPSVDSTTISDSSLTRILSSNRTPATDTSTISDASLTRVQSTSRSPLSDDTTVTDASLTRLATISRSTAEEELSIDNPVSRISLILRTLSTETYQIDSALARLRSILTNFPETVQIDETSLQRLRMIIRALPTETAEISTIVARIFYAFRTITTETLTVGTVLVGAKTFTRAITTELVEVQTQLEKILYAFRSISVDAEINSELNRIAYIFRSLSGSAEISSIVEYLKSVSRNISDETVQVSTIVSRFISIIKTVPQESFTVASNVDVTIPGLIMRSVSQSFSILASVAEGIFQYESGVTRTLYANRAVDGEAQISTIVSKIISLVKTIIETPLISSIVSSIYFPAAAYRNVYENIIIGSGLTTRGFLFIVKRFVTIFRKNSGLSFTRG